MEIPLEADKVLNNVRSNMIVLHGFYENGKVTITDKNLPDMKTEVEIIIRKKSWQRNVRRVKLTNKVLASDTIIKMRNEN